MSFSHKPVQSLDHYETATTGLSRNPSRFFIRNEEFKLTNTRLGSGAYGYIIKTEKAKTDAETSELVVKKIPLDFYKECKEKYPEYNEEQLGTFAKEIYKKEWGNIKRETFIWQMYYPSCHSIRLFINTNDKIARVILPKIPGDPFSCLYFENELAFLSIWIKALQETHILHTVYKIVHGDLTPDNIHYHNNNVYLCDFGAARRIGETTSGKWAIEATHLHPELKPSDKIPPPASVRHDIYSLGKMLKWFDTEITDGQKGKTTRKNIRKIFFRNIYKGMTNPHKDLQWSLIKARNESIKMYNLLQSNSAEEISLDVIAKHQGSTITLSFNDPSPIAQTIIPPKDALHPIDLSDQYFEPIPEALNEFKSSEKSRKLTTKTIQTNDNNSTTTSTPLTKIAHESKLSSSVQPSLQVQPTGETTPITLSFDSLFSSSASSSVTTTPATPKPLITGLTSK